MSVSPIYTDVDRALWEVLGLRYCGADDDGWQDLGVTSAPTSADRPGAEVRVELCQMPARFWRFTISPLIEDVKPVVLSTGSGALSDFWPTVELFAGGMLVVERAKGGGRSV